MSEILREAVAANPVKKGKRWLVNVAVPGQGTSGTYSSELFESYIATALPAGSKAYWGHKKPEDRDPRDQLGKYPDGVFWNTETATAQAYLEPYPRWAPILEEMGSDLELSINVMGTKDAEGNVLTLDYTRANTVDAVGFAGLSGSSLLEQVESLAESLQSGKPGGNSSQEKEEILMDPTQYAEFKGLLESILGAFAAKAKDEAQVVADEAAATVAATAAVEAYAANVAVVEGAREALLPAQVTELMESAKTSDITVLSAKVETAKTIAQEAKQAVLSESGAGRDFGSGTVTVATDLGKVFG